MIVILISPILMIGMPFLQDRKVWNFEFGYRDLFVIWFLAIVIYLLSVFCFLTLKTRNSGLTLQGLPGDPHKRLYIHLCQIHILFSPFTHVRQ